MKKYVLINNLQNYVIYKYQNNNKTNTIIIICSLYLNNMHARSNPRYLNVTNIDFANVSTLPINYALITFVKTIVQHKHNFILKIL